MSKLHWQITGPATAPVLVLLNSLGTSSAMWRYQLGPLSEQFRVVEIDARGHGRSAAPAPGTADLADLAGDVLAALDELAAQHGAHRVHLAGLSLGGMVAMWLAAHHPERVGRLALLCTAAHLSQGQAYLDRAATVRRDGTAAIAQATVERWITPGLADRDPALRQWLVELVSSVNDEGYAQCAEAIATVDLREDLARISAATLIIAGEQDPAMPPEHARALAAGIAGSELRVLSPAAHIAPLEASGAITELLLNHFGAPRSLAVGEQTRRAVLGDAHVDRAVDQLTDFNRPFQEFITRYAWGDVWSRPGLAGRERSIATLAALTALGTEHELGMHVLAAHRNGLSADEIREVLLHTAIYAGVPRANRAFVIAGEVLRAVEPS